jgi:hypothetical protein
MKTTIEIPDSIFRRAKLKAAELGISLRQFVTEAVAARLQGLAMNRRRPWMKHFGTLKGVRKETRRINKIIEDASEKIDKEMWK